eukprot:4503636-Ditylum_brightwellii.AAC.1
MAINRALAAGTKIGEGAQTQNNYESLLLLTTMETLLLSVICFQGLPMWEENWESLISWHRMGHVMETAAKFWHDSAVQNLSQNAASRFHQTH